MYHAEDIRKDWRMEMVFYSYFSLFLLILCICFRVIDKTECTTVVAVHT